ncbi:MAG: Dabb family protein [Spirochaetaceae bacterium]|jgi:heme-degrading monooxygenase HmoA|nr:Dabb family protein [Spirochaetaceae bacterium]
MVRHLALFTLTPEARREGIDAVVEKINESARRMLGEVPGLLVMEVCRNIVDAPHDIALYSEFDTEDALITYRTHPAHTAHKERVKPYLSNREVIDLRAR